MNRKTNLRVVASQNQAPSDNMMPDKNSPDSQNPQNPGPSDPVPQVPNPLEPNPQPQPPAPIPIKDPILVPPQATKIIARGKVTQPTFVLRRLRLRLSRQARRFHIAHRISPVAAMGVRLPHGNGRQ